MNSYTLPVLAQIDIIQVLVVGAVIISMIGGQLAKAFKQAEERRALERMRRSQSQRPAAMQSERAAPSQPAPSAAVGLDELAARRRQKLQELAQKRQVSRARPTTPTPDMASQQSASMSQTNRAQQLQRARAEALAKRRAEALRGRTATSTAPRSPAAPQSRGVQHPSAKAPAAAQPAKPRQTRATPTSRSPQLVQKKQPPNDRHSYHEASDTPSKPARHLATPVGNTAENMLAMQRGLSQIPLREAILLKEILDRPLALRD